MNHDGRTVIVRAALALVAFAAWPLAARGQAKVAREPLKRDPLPSVLRPACPATGPGLAAPTAQQRQQARDFASRAQQAAILGDTATALARLRDAKTADPTDPDIAYQLARLYESGGAADNAVGEYCRFLTLAPNTPDAVDARSRVSVLAKPTPDPAIEAANELFKEGLAAYDAGRVVDAEGKFGRVIAAQPAWGDVYYDRAITRLAQGQRDSAATDLEGYLRVKAGATDRQAVNARIDGLRRVRLSPGEALAWGVVIPGAGQFYTHRPGWGTALLLSAGGAVGVALVSQTKATTVQRTANDPFGNPYTFTTTTRTTDRPYLVPGLMAAGTISILGAVEAALHTVRSNSEPSQRVSLFVLPSRNIFAVRVAY